MPLKCDLSISYCPPLPDPALQELYLSSKTRKVTQIRNMPVNKPGTNSWQTKTWPQTLTRFDALFPICNVQDQSGLICNYRAVYEEKIQRKTARVCVRFLDVSASRLKQCMNSDQSSQNWRQNGHKSAGNMQFAVVRGIDQVALHWQLDLLSLFQNPDAHPSFTNVLFERRFSAILSMREAFPLRDSWPSVPRPRRKSVLPPYPSRVGIAVQLQNPYEEVL